MSGAAAGPQVPAAQPPPAKRQKASGGGRGGAFPLAGCLVFMPHASQLTAAGLDPSSLTVGIPRLGGSLTHNHRRAASVTHALVPSIPPAGGSATWAWLPPELLPGSAVAGPGLQYVTPAWAADSIAWRERRPEAEYAPQERYSGVPAPATAAAARPTVAAAAGATVAVPTPVAARPAARRASHPVPARPTTTAMHASSAVAIAARGAARSMPARASPPAGHAAGAALAPPPELTQLTGHAARCVGCLLGVMCGDVLGAPVESIGKTERHNWRKTRAAHPGGLRDFVANIRYTDDTQMTIALVKSLVACGRCDPDHCAKEYGREEHINHIRGYSRATRDKLRGLYNGRATWRTSGSDTWGSGSVMRIAPIGLAYRNAPPAALRTAVYHAVVCTHDNQEAIDAAVCQAAAVAALCKSGVSGPAVSTPQQLIDHLLPLAETWQLRSRLRAISEALDQLPAGSDTAAVRSQVWEGRAGDAQWEADRRLLNQVVSDRGDDYYYQVRAVDAVCSALWALCRHWFQPEAVIIGAVHQGGDADTVGAIAGALAGAQAGCAWVPHRWWSALKTKISHPQSGAVALVNLAQRLARLDVRQ